MSHPWSVRKKHSHYCLVELYARCFTARMAVKWQSAKHPVKNLQALLILSYLSSHIEATSRPILTTDWTIRCRTSLIVANPRGKLGKLRPTFKRSKIVQCEASLTFKMWGLGMLSNPIRGPVSFGSKRLQQSMEFLYNETLQQTSRPLLSKLVWKTTNLGIWSPLEAPALHTLPHSAAVAAWHHCVNSLRSAH